MLHSMWSLAYILVFVQFMHALDLHDPVPFPPFTRLAFGHPFSVTWTLDGNETGDRLLLRARPVDSEGSNWVTLVGSVKLSDQKVTAQIDQTSSSSLPSVAFMLEALDPTNQLNPYASISIGVFSDSIVTSTKNEPSTPSRTTTEQTANGGPSSQNPQPSPSATISADETTTGTSPSPPPSPSPQSTFAPNEAPTRSTTSPSAVPSPPTTFSTETPSESSQPQEIAKHIIPIGPIIGGAVGGLAVFALAILCIFLHKRHQKLDLNAVPMLHDETRTVPVTKRERLELEMTHAQRQREQLQSDLETIRHRSVHEPSVTDDMAITGDGFENDAQRLRFEVGMMSERILELEEALQELEGDDRIPTHPPPEYASVADQTR